jgi:hypothetical protein
MWGYLKAQLHFHHPSILHDTPQALIQHKPHINPNSLYMKFFDKPPFKSNSRKSFIYLIFNIFYFFKFPDSHIFSTTIKSLIFKLES